MEPKHVILAKQLASICHLFSNERRILIVWSLFTEEKSVGDIAEEIDTSIQNASQHLRLMADKGFLSCRRDGRHIYYSLSGTHLPINWHILLDQQQYYQTTDKEKSNV